MFLKIINGRVQLFNNCGQCVKTFYTGAEGNPVRVDWFNIQTRTIQVLLENGKILLINSGCQIIRHI